MIELQFSCGSICFPTSDKDELKILNLSIKFAILTHFPCVGIAQIVPRTKRMRFSGVSYVFVSQNVDL